MFTGFGLAVGDRAADLGGDLLVEVGGIPLFTLTPIMMLVILA